MIDVKEMDKIREIIGGEISKLEKQLEKSMDSRFKQLEDKIAAAQVHTDDMFKTRVTDNACSIHRHSQEEKLSKQNEKIATIMATQKTTSKIVMFILGMIIPVSIIGVVYGIIVYQQVQSLLP
jgi:ABC-type lipoprotein release transport system permease subunit